MNKKYIPAVLIVVLALAGSIATIVSLQKDSKTETSDTSACQNAGKTYTLMIENDAFDTSSIKVQRCDRIEVINKDNAARLIALGTHENHISYPGFKETSLGAGDNFTFTLFKAGKYLIHDHIHDEVAATITVL